MTKSLRLEICRLLWPEAYADAELDDTSTVSWNEPDDNDIVDAVRDLIRCRNRFVTVADFMATRTESLKNDVDEILEDIGANGGFLPNIGEKK